MSVATAFFSPAQAAHPPRSAAGAAATGEPGLRAQGPLPLGTITAGLTWRLPPRVYSPPVARRQRRAMAVPLTPADDVARPAGRGWWRLLGRGGP